MKIYLIGCTHFGHSNIIRLANRLYDSVEAMDADIIEKWNRRVRPQDTVYHLGDFAFRGAPGNDYLTKLNGRIILLQGNHDPRGWGRDMIAFNYHKRKIVLCHYPIEEWDGWYRDSIHFHAHTHSMTFKSATRRGNVGVDAIEFEPILIDDAIERLTS